LGAPEPRVAFARWLWLPRVTRASSTPLVHPLTLARTACDRADDCPAKNVDFEALYRFCWVIGKVQSQRPQHENLGESWGFRRFFK